VSLPAPVPVAPKSKGFTGAPVIIEKLTLVNAI
jgi:hypothetical protein